MKPEQLVGQRVAEFRGLLGLTQQQLAERMEPLLGKTWTRQTVSAAEQGNRSFTATDLYALAHALGTWPSRLLFPPQGVTGVEMPTGVEFTGRDLHSPDLGATEELLYMASELLGRLIHQYRERTQWDNDALSQMLPVWAAMQEAMQTDRVLPITKGPIQPDGSQTQTIHTNEGSTDG